MTLELRVAVQSCVYNVYRDTQHASLEGATSQLIPMSCSPQTPYILYVFVLKLTAIQVREGGVMAIASSVDLF